MNSTERPALGSRAGEGNNSIKAGSLNVTGNGSNKNGSVLYVAKDTEMEIIVDNLTVENTSEEGNAIVIEDAFTGVTVNGTTVVDGDIEVKSGGDLDINFNSGTWNVPEESNVTELTGDVNIKVAKIEDGFVTVEKTDDLA